MGIKLTQIMVNKWEEEIPIEYKFHKAGELSYGKKSQMLVLDLAKRGGMGM